MGRTLLIALILCFSQLGLSTAQADWEDVYLKLGVGLANVEAEDATIVHIIGPHEVLPYDEVEFDSESSASYQLGMGYKLDSYITLELALQHTSGFDLEGPYLNNGVPLADRNNGVVDLETTAVMVSGLLDMATILDIDWQLRPYIGLGLGYAKNKLGRFTFDPPELQNIEGNTENNFAWKATLGATYPITEHFVLDAAYSYADYGDAESSRSATNFNGDPITIDLPLTYDVNTQEFFLSVRYLF